MVCKSNAFVGTHEQTKNWKNWSGDVPFSAEEYFEPAHTSPTGPPDGLLQLVHVVARATGENKPLKAIGSGWAFEDLAKSDSWVVSLRQLMRRLDNVVGPTSSALTAGWRQKQLNVNESTRLVHVEAGIEIGELSQMLQDDGLALPTVGGSNGQSLAGAISTSTHGGDWQQTPLPDVVRAIHLVTDGGRSG
jgi:FAD/FMN-containing dehydrogenase